MAGTDGGYMRGLPRWWPGGHRGTLVTLAVLLVGALLGPAGPAAAAPSSLLAEPSAPLLTGPAPAVPSAAGEAQVSSADASSAGEVVPYSKDPSEAEPFAVCPPPTKERASCLAVGAAVPSEAAAAGLPRPEYQGSGEKGGFSPADLQSAYKLPSEGGGGETVAITIAYGDEHAEADLKEFRKVYGLPPCTKETGCLTIVNQRGETGKEPVESPSWAEEASLDLDMVSAACPKCHILLVQADTNELTDMGAAVEEAAKPKYGAVAISNSWATEQFSGESTYNHYFEHAGIPVLFAGGDWGYRVEYPAAMPSSVSVGGTHLEKSGSSRGWSESAWSMTGSGCSAYEAKPSWQGDEGCAKRSLNDVSAVADPETPVSVYDKKWLNFGGTSAATPLTAGVEALSSSVIRKEGPRAFSRLGQAGALFDPTSGKNGTCPNYLCQAGVGYDGPTGWGTPDGPLSPQVAVTEGTSVASGSTETLHGSVDPNGHATEYHFEYGETTAYGSVVPIPDKSAGAGSEYVEVSQLLEGLKGHRTYHYRITATNSEGTFHGADHSFGTTAPTAASEPASGIGAYRATLNGLVNPEGSASHYYFEYGPTTSYGTAQPLGGVEVAAGGEAVEASTALSGLSPNSTYHYRIVAKNSAGVATGADRTFTTDAPQWETREIPQPPESGHGEETYGLSCVHPNACIAVGGNWSLKVHTRVTLAETWNGTAWTPMTTPNPAGLEEGWLYGRYAVLRGVSCPTESSCIAVGEYRDTSEAIKPLVESFNGSAWSIVPISMPTGATAGSLAAVSCLSASSCTAVGFYRDAGGTERPLAERWGGTEWTVQSMPTPEGAVNAVRLNGVSCASGTMCIAVGQFGKFAGLEQFAERWDGSKWSIQAKPTAGSFEPPSGLYGIACTSETSCRAVGYQSKIIRGSLRSTVLVEIWNGSEWQVQSTPVELDENESLGLVSLSCTSASSCLAVGSHYNPGVVGHGFHPFAERWDGSAWSLAELADLSVPSGYWHESWLNAVSCAEVAACTAVGESLTAPEGELAFRVSFADQTIGLPGASTRAASAVGRNEATLNGTVNPAGAETSYYFEYGPSTSYGSKTESAGAGSGTSDVEVSKAVAGLESGTTFHYRVVATNSHGTVHGADKTFSTNGWELRASSNAESASESGLEWTSCASSTACEAVGYDKNGSGADVTLAERWNGSEWSIQSTPIPSGAKSTVLEWVSCVSASMCEATGHYENSSGVVVTLAERWNGSEWSIQSTPNPEGASRSELREVSCSSTTLCTAVGRYTNGSGTNFALAERWNGTKWEIQATPTPEGAQHTLLYGVSCSSATECEASGYYVNASGYAVPLAERWNGVTWALQAAPAPAGASNSYLIGTACSSSSACTAVGYYYNSSGTIVSLAERWNGAKWEIQSTPNPEGAKATHLVGVSCTSSTACSASGDYTNSSGVRNPLAESWNGTKWEVQSMPSPSGAKEGDLDGGVSCTSASVCTAVGRYTNASSVVVTLAERWNGTKWEVQSTPNREAVEDDYFSGEPSCTSTTACEAVGAALGVGGSGYRPTAEGWNGAEWTLQWAPIPAGAKEGILTSTSCTAASACTAVGQYQNASGVNQTLAERWNGTEWSIQSTPNPEGATDSRLTSVSCVSSSTCAATGYEKNSSGVWVALAESWNGSAWSVQSMPNPSGALETKPEGVSCPSASSCESTGSYVNGSGSRLTLAESWNGTKWEVQATPNPEEAKEARLYGVSCTSTSSCESTGTYESASGVRLTLAERWNGTSWEAQSIPISKGAEESVLQGVSCTSSTACEATGWQSSAGEHPPLAEHWNGTAWMIRAAPSPGGSKGAYLGGVSCTAASTCMATGYYLNPSSTALTLAESIGGIAPVAATRSATSLSETTVTVNGAVNPKGASTEYFFEYGASAAYGSSTASANAGSGSTTQDVSHAISGLEAGHSYHFRIVASNATGTSRGEDQVFKTPQWTIRTTPTSVGALLQDVSCASADECVAVGSQSEGGTKALAELWNGAEWSKMTASGGGLGDVSCVASSSCVALPSSGLGVLRWNGSEWSTIAAATPPEATNPLLMGLSCTSSTFCVAVGRYTLPGWKTRTLAESYNGEKWTILATPNEEGGENVLTAISCTSSVSCTAIGIKGGKPLALRWNGSEWSTLAAPKHAPNWTYSDISCGSTSACLAVGDGFGDAERWNGTEWISTVIPKPKDAEGGAELQAVSCVTASECIAAGYYEREGGGIFTPLAEHWDGSEWTVQKAVNPGGEGENELLGVSCNSAIRCIAVGFRLWEAEPLAESYE